LRSRTIRKPLQDIKERVEEVREEFPDIAEFTMELRGVMFFGTYRMLKNGVCQVFMVPEVEAEEILQPHGLTAIPGQ
jgi:hypothetical protein